MQIFKKEMKLMGLSGVDVAKELEIEKQNISGWISGNYKPGPKMVLKLKEIGFSDTACLNPSKDVEV